MCISDLCRSSTINSPHAGGFGVRVRPASCVLVPKCYPKPPPTKRIRKWFLLVNTGMLAKRPAFRHGGKPSKSAAISAPRKLLRGGRIALILQVFSNGFVKFIEKCVADRKGLKSRVNSCILKIKITAGPDRWSAGVMDGSKREGVIKKSRKVNTEERDLVGRTAAHGAHQQTIR